jgi:hypothetical protein
MNNGRIVDQYPGYGVEPAAGAVVGGYENHTENKGSTVSKMNLYRCLAGIVATLFGVGCAIKIENIIPIKIDNVIPGDWIFSDGRHYVNCVDPDLLQSRTTTILIWLQERPKTIPMTVEVNGKIIQRYSLTRADVLATEGLKDQWVCEFRVSEPFDPEREPVSINGQEFKAAQSVDISPGTWSNKIFTTGESDDSNRTLLRFNRVVKNRFRNSMEIPSWTKEAIVLHFDRHSTVYFFDYAMEPSKSVRLTK